MKFCPHKSTATMVLCSRVSRRSKTISDGSCPDGSGANFSYCEEDHQTTIPRTYFDPERQDSFLVPSSVKKMCELATSLVELTDFSVNEEKHPEMCLLAEFLYDNHGLLDVRPREATSGILLGSSPVPDAKALLRFLVDPNEVNPCLDMRFF
eukprot:Gregarina_sp_Poly_1__10600@NODE_790_length_6283_cov_36_487934_g578_i0_p3_GENE_NODE_790_length_6283_cov_36_487934_g578_i0NODE_790_length_6283_cov_36_487934_g578_i0_p3_ORF_typecomplete_len152_score17_84_NODE_790_length_6283_cov_36_487934_g578_i039144369